MIQVCSKHRQPGDPPGGEILWGLLLPPGKTALILCVRGHYIRIRSSIVPLFPFIAPGVAA